MKLIECITGPAEPTIGGTSYVFERDGGGRFVCEVTNLVHRSCLLSVTDHYREAEPLAVVLGDPAKPEELDDENDENDDEDDDGQGADEIGLGETVEPGPEPATAPKARKPRK